jgi:DNA-binding CsgD family transcriptional regulator
MIKPSEIQNELPSACCLALLARMFDAIDHCLAIYDGRGTMHYANRAMLEHLGTAVNEDSLRHELETIAGQVRSARLQMRSNAGIERVTHCTLDREDGSYTVEGIHVAGGILGEEPAILLSMRLPPPNPFCGIILKKRYGLTKKQITVARLVAKGLRNDEIARRLCISEHTARHHVEQIKLKVGAHTRAAVAARIIGGVEPCEKL